MVAMSESSVQRSKHHPNRSGGNRSSSGNRSSDHRSGDHRSSDHRSGDHRSSDHRSGSSRARGADDVLVGLRDQVSDVAERVASATRDFKEQAMQKASELTRAVADGVRDEAERFFDEHKGRLGERVQRVGKGINQAAHALRAVRAEGLAEAVDSAAGRFDEVSQYLDERSLGDLVSDAGEFVRRNPAPVVGGLFLTGFLAARFVKASASRETDEGNESEEGSSRRGAAHGRNGRASARR